jgi:chemotaxis protein MotA
MLPIIGFIVVTVSVIGGYLMAKGNLWVLLQPAEVVIIVGAAIGGFIISSPMKVIKAVISAVTGALGHKPYDKAYYLELLIMLNGIFTKVRQQGLVSVEADVDNPEASPLFNAYPEVLKNHHAVSLIADTLRMVMTTSIAPHELEALIDSEIETHHTELLAPSKSVSLVADALPGLGIVAAVLGVVITMGHINEPPEVLGKSIAAALVGTFLGVLLCYGYVGPLGKSLEHAAEEDLQVLNVIKVTIISFVGGAAAKVAVEFGRRVIPTSEKPSFLEVEEQLRTRKK